MSRSLLLPALLLLAPSTASAQLEAHRVAVLPIPGGSIILDAVLKRSSGVSTSYVRMHAFNGQRNVRSEITVVDLRQFLDSAKAFAASHIEVVAPDHVDTIGPQLYDLTTGGPVILTTRRAFAASSRFGVSIGHPNERRIALTMTRAEFESFMSHFERATIRAEKLYRDANP